MSVGPHSEKFNIVSNDHGRTQKCGFCVSVGKTNFTNHHTPDTINGFKESVLVCKMHDRYSTIRKNFEHSHSFSSGLLIKTASDCNGQTSYMKTNHFKMLLNYLTLNILTQIVQYIDYSIAKNSLNQHLQQNK